MRATCEGVKLRIEAEPGDPFGGQVEAQRIKVHPEYGRMVDCGRVMVRGRVRPLCIRLDTRPELAAVAAEWEAAVAAAKEAELKAEEVARRKIVTGETLIELFYHDGEYLSGHMALGQAAELLIAVGAAKHVRGWGAHVCPEVVAALGERFAYPAAVEYTRPQRESEEAARQTEKEAVQAIEREARDTGNRQALRRWVTDRCMNGNDDQCSFDAAVEWVYPDGTRRITYTCCY